MESPSRPHRRHPSVSPSLSPPPSGRRARASDYMDPRAKERASPPPPSEGQKERKGHRRRSRSPSSPHRRDRDKHKSSRRGYSSDSHSPRNRRSDRSRDRRRDGDGGRDRRNVYDGDEEEEDHRRERRKGRGDEDDPRLRRPSEKDGARERGRRGEEQDRNSAPLSKRRRHSPNGSTSPPPRRHEHKQRDDYDESRRRRKQSPPRDEAATKRAMGPLPSQQDAFVGSGTSGAVAQPADKQKPNFSRSGKLAAETNTVAGTAVVLKYHEPAEARLPPPSADWRLFEFKDSETVSTTALSERSCWLFGREKAVADFTVLHPSCSAQHAVLQFRHVDKKNEFGDRVGKVKLYVLDLESANGTWLNGDRIAERRYVEVRAGDVIKFGESTREYVVMLAS